MNVIEAIQIKAPGLKNVSFTAQNAATTTITGGTLEQRSTLLQILGGLQEAQSGKIIYFDHAYLSKELKTRESYALITKTGELIWPNRKVKEIAEMMRPFYSKWDDRLFLQFLSDFGIDPSWKIASLTPLDVIALKTALSAAHHAKLLLFEEPFTNLTEENKERLHVMLAELAASGFGVVVTSSLEELRAPLPNRIVILKDGRSIVCTSRETFNDAFRMVHFEPSVYEKFTQEQKELLVGLTTDNDLMTALISVDEAPNFELMTMPASPEDVRQALTKEFNYEE